MKLICTPTGVSSVKIQNSNQRKQPAENVNNIPQHLCSQQEMLDDSSLRFIQMDISSTLLARAVIAAYLTSSEQSIRQSTDDLSHLTLT